MKLREIGLTTGLFIGGGLMLFGGFTMSMSPSDDPTGIMIVLGLLFFVPGLIIAAVAVLGWLVGKLYSSLGATTKQYVRWGLALVVFGAFVWLPISNGIRQANVPANPDSPDFPFMAGTWGGDVASHESWRDFENKPLEFIDSVSSGVPIKLLGFGVSSKHSHIPFNHDFPWFHIEYGDGQRGLMWGGNLCATATWANGLNRSCPSREGTAPATDAKIEEQQALLQLIEYSYDTLPGTWQEVPEQETDEIQSILVIHPQEGVEKFYAQRAKKYYGNDLHEGTWNLAPASPELEEGSEPIARQLHLTVSSLRHVGSVYADILSLDVERLILSSGNGYNKTTYRRVADPDQLISTWEEQAAERMRIVAANAPRPEVEMLASTAIEGLPDAYERVFRTPVAAQSSMGKIRSGPGTQYSQIGSLTRGGTVQLLAVTDVQWASFLWYRIRHEGGLEGYAAGGLLCAREHWIEGVHHNCEGF